MSIISTRPQVKSVVNARVLESVTSIAEVIGCASALSSNLAMICRRASATHSSATIQAVAPLLQNVGHLQQRKLSGIKANAKLSHVEALKTSMLEAIADSPFVVSNPSAIAAPLKTVTAANSIPEITRAGQLLLKEIAKEHNGVLVNSLRLACANAFTKIGFTSIQTMPSTDAKVRLVATNAEGKTLVTEIERDAQQELSISTEIVSGCDSTSQDILDAFDKALEEEGVRASAPVRKETGGVCQLEASRLVQATRKFVRGQAQPASNKSANAGDGAARRSQRLNKRDQQRQRQR